MDLCAKHEEDEMEVYIGIDWSANKHDIAFVNQAGAVLDFFTINHTESGLHRLDATRVKLGLAPSDCLVALETAHNLIIDFLWGHGYHKVYVVPPTVVKSSRQLHRQSGARNDQSDAFFLARLLRHERDTLHLWRPDQLLTRQIRAQVSLVIHLKNTQNRMCNRLRDTLLRYYPAACNLFSKLESSISLSFISSYPTPDDSMAISFDEFKQFTRKHRYPRPALLAGVYARLQDEYPVASEDTVMVFRDQAVELATLLQTIVEELAGAERQLTKLFSQHPDRDIFASLPGVGDWLAPALLSKFGDDRERFPTPQSVQALAGTCPVTVESGKKRSVLFRRSCDRQFRQIAQQWAISSLKVSVWANAYFRQISPRSHSTSHAYRCLANRWLAVAWKLWQTGMVYDEAYHLKKRAEKTSFKK